MKPTEIIKDAMIDLINKTAEFKESFVFEQLQDYMDFSEGKATWTSNVRLRMLEIHEAREETAKQMQESFIEMIEKINEFKWLHNNFLKRQSKGCMDEEAFCFTLKEIKERLKQEVEG